MKKRILVLDDSQDILDIVQEVLTYEHYEVRCADSYARFHEIMARWQPDLFIVDFRLGDSNGGEICRGLKTHPKTSHLPVILFSAYFSHQKELLFGCNAVINKPFDLEELTTKVQEVLAGNRVS
jgi:CheY-like chemotaxis protein